MMDEIEVLGSKIFLIYSMRNATRIQLTLPSAVEGYALLTEWIGFLVVDLYFHIFYFS